MKINCQGYQIKIGNYWDEFKDYLSQQKFSKIAVLVDENTDQHCLPLFAEGIGNHEFIKIKIQSGEKYKNIVTCERIWGAMVDHRLDRSSLVINLGGGVIGDMGGFCARTYMRGIPFIQIPTTLLAQVDASVGGKLGIDFRDLKNLIGVFNDPFMVCIDPRFLTTLPIRQLRSGFAEIIKHALIRDADLWNLLLKTRDFTDMDWQSLIARNVEIKKEVVEEDVFESGVRKILNFGHTLGHAVETTFLNTQNPLLHGEAIAIGMICESFLSMKRGSIEEIDLEEISRYLLSMYNLPASLKEYHSQILNYIMHDKKILKAISCFQR